LAKLSLALLLISAYRLCIVSIAFSQRCTYTVDERCPKRKNLPLWRSAVRAVSRAVNLTPEERKRLARKAAARVEGQVAMTQAVFGNKPVAGIDAATEKN